MRNLTLIRHRFCLILPIPLSNGDVPIDNRGQSCFLKSVFAISIHMAVGVASDLLYYAFNICQKLGMLHLVGLVLECLERTKSQPDAPCRPGWLNLAGSGSMALHLPRPTGVIGTSLELEVRANSGTRIGFLRAHLYIKGLVSFTAYFSCFPD